MQIDGEKGAWSVAVVATLEKVQATSDPGESIRAERVPRTREFRTKADRIEERSPSGEFGGGLPPTTIRTCVRGAPYYHVPVSFKQPTYLCS